MTDINPASVMQLRKDTARLMHFYRDKSSWPDAYPFLARLCEDYTRHYTANSVAVQAQLSFCLEKAGYTTNFATNAAVLICMMAKRMGYDDQCCQTMLGAVFGSVLSVHEEHQRLARGLSLNEIQQKRWQHRYHLSLKVLTSEGTSQPAIAGILAKLDKYKSALIKGGQIMLYDGMTRLVAVAVILAGRITPEGARRSVSLTRAIADLYIRTNDHSAQQLLKHLKAETGTCLPGTRFRLSGEHYFYLGQSQDNKTLVAQLKDKKLLLRSINQDVTASSVQLATTDPRLLARIWFKIDTLLLTPEGQEKPVELDALFDSLSKCNQSYSQLVSLLSPYPGLTQEVQTAAEAYNREGHKAANLRHALSMVGSYNAPVFISRVIMQHQLMAISHPLDRFIKARVKGVLALCRLLVSRHQDIQFEQLGACVMAYLLFVCRHASPLVSRTANIPAAKNSDRLLPLSHILGAPKPVQSELSAFVAHHIGMGTWPSALLESETADKAKLNGNARFFVVLKLLCFIAYIPNYQMSAWQSQLLNTCAKELQWRNADVLLSHLNEAGLYNGI